MLTVNEFKTYIASITAQIAVIQKDFVVIDDSQLSKFLQDALPDEIMVVGVIAKHKPNGTADSLRSRDITSILVLEKMVRGDQTHDDFLTKLNNLQSATKLVVDKLLDDYQNDDYCSFMRYLEPSSLDINPLWSLNSCDGYQIDFSLNTVF